MADNVLAREYVELTASGDLDAKLADVRRELEAADKALTRASGGFRTFFMEKIGLSKRLLEAQKEIAKSENALYDTGPYQRYVQAHVQLSSQLASNQKKAQVAGMTAQTSFQGTSQGASMLREQAQMEKQLKRLSEIDTWQRMVAGQGLVSASLTKLTDKTKEFQSVAAVTFATATGAIGSFAAAASPEIFGTLTGSMQLVAGAIGEAFLPYVIEASQWLQNLADDIRDMDPAVVKQIASWVMWGAGIAGAIVVLPRLITFGRSVLTVLHTMDMAAVAAARGMVSAATAARAGAVSFTTLGTSLRAAGAAMTAFALANPVTTILAIGSALYGLVSMFSSAAHEVRDLGDALQQVEQREQALREGRALTHQQLRSGLGALYDPLVQNRNNRPRQLEILRGALPAAEENARNPTAAANRFVDYALAQQGMNRGHLTPEQLRDMLLNVESQVRASPQMLHQLLEHPEQLNVLGGNQRHGPIMRRPNMEVGGGDIAGQWMRMQQAMLKDPMEMEQKRRQFEAYERMIRALDRNTQAQGTAAPAGSGGSEVLLGGS